MGTDPRATHEPATTDSRVGFAASRGVTPRDGVEVSRRAERCPGRTPGRTDRVRTVPAQRLSQGARGGQKDSRRAGAWSGHARLPGRRDFWKTGERCGGATNDREVARPYSLC